MNHIPNLDLSKTRIIEPIIKGKNYKSREVKHEGKKEVNPEKEKGKVKRESVKLEPTYDD